jgi:large conductance mechanosensitive channel
MGLLQEFKAFAVKGNAIDLAIGVVIGASFGKIVSSLVDNLIMPFVGLFSGGVNFTSLKLKLANPAPIPGLASPEPATLEYGKFIQATVDFLIVAFVLFLIVQGLNRLKRKEEVAPAPAAPPAPTPEQLLLTEIRDLLKQAPPLLQQATPVKSMTMSSEVQK